MKLADNDGAATQDQGGQTGDDTTQQLADETSTGSQDQGDAGTGDQGEADDEVVITIGEASPPSDEEEQHRAAPQWVKDLRTADREKTRKIRELEQQLAGKQQAEKPAAVAKPTLADCDYDEEAFESKLTAWHEQQRAAAAEQQQKADAEKKSQTDWQAKIDAYGAAKVALKVTGFDDAEAAVKEVFSPVQQAIMLDAVETPDLQAKLVYALGNNPAELKRISSITNPVKFAVAVANLEKKLTVTSRTKPPAPEREVRGTAPASGVTNSKLASLEAEADRTGDRSKVIAYRREMRRNQA